MKKTLALVAAVAILALVPGCKWPFSHHKHEAHEAAHEVVAHEAAPVEAHEAAAHEAAHEAAAPAEHAEQK